MLCIVVYLDDGITAAQNFSRCEEQSLLVRSNPSSETQGQIAEARGSLNGQKKMATKKSIVGREEPLGTSSYQTSSKQQG